MERRFGIPPLTVVLEVPKLGTVEIIPPIHLGRRVQINMLTGKGIVPCPHFNQACHYRDLSLLLAEDAQTGTLRQFVCSRIDCQLAEFTS